jgi:hypothetical protein
MKTINELLRDADPLQQEPEVPSDEWVSRRRFVLEAASSSRTGSRVRSRSRIVVFAIVTFILIVVSSFGSRVWSPFVSDLQGAVHFEVRLAEEKPGPGLREAKLSGPGGSIYLHSEVVVDNSDIATARVVQANGSSNYDVSITFKQSGAEKMRAATTNHIGKPMAILLDGRVVMAPVLRSPIDAAAMISGSFTKAEAQRIVKGIGIQ